MFGFAAADPQKLSPEERLRYRGLYCGLCAALGRDRRFGDRLTLSYDFVLLQLVLSGVAGEGFEETRARCAVHPVRAHLQLANRFTKYAAEMDLLLSYEKTLDDLRDEGGARPRAAAALLKKDADLVKAAYPALAAAIEKALSEISEAEAHNVFDPEVPGNAFGRLLGEVFAYPEIEAKQERYRFGFCLGKAIYFMDAAVDLHADLRKLRYNPLIRTPPEQIEPALELLLGMTMQALDALPMQQDKALVENILLSGIWTIYENTRRKEEKRHGKRPL